MKKLLLLASISAMLVGCGPSSSPTEAPTSAPTETPTSAPTEAPTSSPTEAPTTTPTEVPTETPTETPTEAPTEPETPLYPEVTGSEALTNLKTSPYTHKMSSKTDLGLTEIHNVGIDEDCLNNETDLYPIPTEGTFYNAEDIGITQTNENNSGIFSIWLANNKSVEGNKIIKFKDGVYPFSTKVDVTGISDLYLVGTGKTEFLYSGFGTYFEAKASKNVQIHNISFDKSTSPTISGVIKKVTNNTDTCEVVLDIPDEFDLSQSIYGEPEGGSSYMECRYDEATGKYVPDNKKNLMYNSPTSANNKGIVGYLYNHSSRELTLTLNKNFAYDNFTTPEVGTHVSYAYTMYESHGFLFQNCEDTVMQNVNVYVSGGMGLRFNEGKNAYINRVNYMTREGSSRIMTCTADIIHTCALEGELIITNSILEASHDDALNIKSFYTKVNSVAAASREITVSQTQNEATISFEAGDVIEVYNTETYEIVDTFTCQDVTKSGTNFTLTVDKRPRGIEEGYCVGNVTKATRMTLDNCLIRNKRNRGILLQGRESVISNCTFQNVIMGPIQVLSVYDIFREAIMPESISIINNKFLNTEGTDISVFTYGTSGGDATVPGTIKNVDILNNFFYNGKGRNVNLLGAGNVNVSNNLIHYDVKNNDLSCTIKNSKDMTFKNNLTIANYGINFISNNGGCSGLTIENNNRREEA